MMSLGTTNCTLIFKELPLGDEALVRKSLLEKQCIISKALLQLS